MATATFDRSPSEPAEFIDEAFKEVCRLARIPEGSAALLQGSIAEGIGDSYSDLDFFVVPPGDEEIPGLATHIRLGERRCEIYLASEASVLALAEHVNGLDPSSEAVLRSLNTTKLDQYQRFANGLPISNPSYVESLQKHYDQEQICNLLAGMRYLRAKDLLWRAEALLLFGRTADAVGTARKALIEAAKGWVARRGDSYLSNRFLPANLERVAGGDRVFAEIQPLLFPGSRIEDPIEFVRGCKDGAARLDVDVLDAAVASLEVRVPEYVTRWDLGACTCLLKRDEDLFWLGADAIRACDAIQQSPRLDDLLTGGDAEPPSGILAAVGELHRHGLVELAQPGSGLRWRETRGSSAANPDACRLTPLGPAFEKDSDDEVRRLPIPAVQVAEATTNLIWSGVLIENNRENFIGAAESGRWSMGAMALRQMVERAAEVILSGFAVAPLPELPHLVSALREVDAVSAETADLIERLLFSDATEEETVRTLYSEVNTLLDSIPAEFSSEVIRGSHESMNSWMQVMGIGLGWVRLAAYVDAPVPLEEAREMLKQSLPDRPGSWRDGTGGEAEGEAKRRLELS